MKRTNQFAAGQMGIDADAFIMMAMGGLSDEWRDER
jgi:hypothetical protein